MKKEFIKWLKSKRLYSAVKRNHKNCTFTLDGDTLSENLDRIGAVEHYLDVFAWIFTPEGDLFWAEKEQQWIKHMKNL